MKESPNYRCLNCGAFFVVEKPGPVERCPHCGTPYMKWLNYEKWRTEQGSCNPRASGRE